MVFRMPLLAALAAALAAQEPPAGPSVLAHGVGADACPGGVPIAIDDVAALAAHWQRIAGGEGQPAAAFARERLWLVPLGRGRGGEPTVTQVLRGRGLLVRIEGARDADLVAGRWALVAVARLWAPPDVAFEADSDAGRGRAAFRVSAVQGMPYAPHLTAPMREPVPLQLFADALAYANFRRAQHLPMDDTEGIDFAKCVVLVAPVGEWAAVEQTVQADRLDVYQAPGVVVVRTAREVQAGDTAAKFAVPTFGVHILPRVPGVVQIDAPLAADAHVVRRVAEFAVDDGVGTPKLSVQRYRTIEVAALPETVCERVQDPTAWRALRSRHPALAALPADFCAFAGTSIVFVATAAGRVWPGFDFAVGAEEGVDVVTAIQRAPPARTPGCTRTPSWPWFPTAGASSRSCCGGSAARRRRRKRRCGSSPAKADDRGVKKAERGVLVGIVVAVGLALRWGYVATATVQNPLRADAGQYAQYAKNLVEHGVYSLATSTPPAPDSFRSPGYPFFLALCRELGGARWLSLALALQVALGAATVWLVYRVARSWLGFAPALVATALAALSPHLVVPCGYALTECVTTFAVVLACSQLRAAGHSPGRAAVAGALLGVVPLCNEAYAVFVPALAWLVLRRHGRARAFAFGLAALLPFAAWSVRNGATELARTGSERVTASISHGSYPGMVYRDPQLFGFPYREDPAQPGFGASWHGIATVLGDRVAAEPLRYASWYLLEKPVWLWQWDLVQGRDVYVYEVANSPYERQPVVGGTHWLMRWLHLPVMVAAAAAAIALAWNGRGRHALPAQALGVVVVLATLAYVPVIPDPRYLTPVRPLLFVLGSGALAMLVAAVQRRLPSRAASVSVDTGR